MKIPKARKLPSGKYFIQLRIKQSDGSTQSIYITENTEKLCIAKAAAIKGGLIENKKTPQSITVKQACLNYISNRENVLSPSTVRGYNTIINTRFSDLMNTKLSALTQRVCQQAINAEAKDKAAKTVVNSWRFVSSCLAQENISFDVRLPQIMPKERPFLDNEQIKTFIKGLHGRSYETAALLALSSLRRSEVCGLDWQDIDLTNNIIHIRGAYVQSKDGKFVKKAATKNVSSYRDVPIMIPRLKELLLVEPNKTGKVVKISPNRLYEDVNFLCEKLNLPLVGMHGLRHSFASLCATELQVPEHICMKWGGWSNPATMKRIYTHASEEQSKKYAQNFEAFFINANNNANKNANETPKRG